MTHHSYAAIDLGAESGRVMLGKFDGKHIQLEEIHRFPNGGVRLGRGYFWNILHLWTEIKIGLGKACEQQKMSLKSIGLDTWGVDFGLLAADDTLIGNPYHYRDDRTNGMLEKAYEKLPKDDIYAQTGIQFMQINSLYQLLSMVATGAPALSMATSFLNMPDLFNFFLTGVKANEFTITTTTQCYNPNKRNWAFPMLDTLGIPTHIFGEIIQPGTVLGTLRRAVAEELGAADLSVVASAGHDTACAVAAVPTDSEDFIYLSSGTWSLLGAELDQPILTPESMNAEMTNEGGFGGKIRFLKNIVGLWLVQECRRRWAQNGISYSYDDMTKMAAAAPAFGALIVPGDTNFLAPDDMPKAIQSYCRMSGQATLEENGAIIRCALESLALEYRWVVEQIDRLTGKEYPVIHIIGGGAKNKLLNQFTANATGRTVITGPVEATAIGNILIQAAALGDISSLAEGRAIVKESFAVTKYKPKERDKWDEAYQRYLHLKQA